VGVARGVGPTTTRASTATHDAHVRCVYFFPRVSSPRARESVVARVVADPSSTDVAHQSHRPIVPSRVVIIIVVDVIRTLVMAAPKRE